MLSCLNHQQSRLQGPAVLSCLELMYNVLGQLVAPTPADMLVRGPTHRLLWLCSSYFPPSLTQKTKFQKHICVVFSY